MQATTNLIKYNLYTGCPKKNGGKILRGILLPFMLIMWIVFVIESCHHFFWDTLYIEGSHIIWPVTEVVNVVTASIRDLTAECVLIEMSD